MENDKTIEQQWMDSKLKYVPEGIDVRVWLDRLGEVNLQDAVLSTDEAEGVIMNNSIALLKKARQEYAELVFAEIARTVGVVKDGVLAGRYETNVGIRYPETVEYLKARGYKVISLVHDSTFGIKIQVVLGYGPGFLVNWKPGKSKG
jgi:hypothetical protein